MGGADILCVCVSVFGGLKKIGEVKWGFSQIARHEISQKVSLNFSKRCSKNVKSCFL